MSQFSWHISEVLVCQIFESKIKIDDFSTKFPFEVGNVPNETLMAEIRLIVAGENGFEKRYKSMLIETSEFSD